MRHVYVCLAEPVKPLDHFARIANEEVAPVRPATRAQILRDVISAAYKNPEFSTIIKRSPAMRLPRSRRMNSMKS
jgi:hypothetical protein